MPLKITRRKGSGIWQISGTVAGERVRESAETADRNIAEEKRAALEASLHRAAIYGKAAVIAWSEAVVSYCGVVEPTAATAALLARINRHFGTILLKDIDQERVDRAIRALCRPDAAPATKLRLVITPIRSVMMHAARRGWCQRPTFETPAGAGGNRRMRWLTPDEYQRLLTAAAPHLRPLIVFLVCTGARLSEAIGLQWEDVDLEHARATFRDVKGRHGELRDRIAILPPAAIAALSSMTYPVKGEPGWSIASREGAVFRTDLGEEYADREGTGGQIKRAWATACRSAGFAGEWREGASGERWWQPEDVTPHVLRHTFATWHYCLYHNLLKLMEDGDWHSSALAQRYAKLAPETMRDAIRAAWGIGNLLTQGTVLDGTSS